jgi:capsular polysaccharide export protein
VGAGEDDAGSKNGQPAGGRRILFLGGPFGPFFRRLATCLQDQGAFVLHINMHGGDWWDWGFRNAITYHGTLDDWPAWVADLLRRERITDLATYGDCGLYTRPALDAAKRIGGVVCHVYELGYIRPDWITLDRDGVNGFSSLSRKASDHRHLPVPKAVDGERIGRLMPYHVLYTILHCIAYYLGKPIFRRYRSGWPSSPLKQAVGYAVRATADRLTARKQRRAERLVLQGREPFYLCALQKSGDSQIRCHSPFRDMVEVIDTVTRSFAYHAPANACLVFKAHPLDYGIEPQEEAVRRAAAEYGLRGRLVFLPTGTLMDLTKKAVGVVTVNSTAGFTALAWGRPTCVLGEAFYRVDDLVAEGDLDRFWREPTAPDMDLYKRFRAQVLALTQINGSYYAPKGRRMALPEAARRMLARQPAVQAASAALWQAAAE